MKDSESTDYLVGTYVSCFYDKKCWFGVIEYVFEEFNDYYINFLHGESSNDQFRFPSKKDSCWVEPYNVLCIMSVPIIKPATTVVYKFNKLEVKKSKDMCNSRIRQCEKQIAKSLKKSVKT